MLAGLTFLGVLVSLGAWRLYEEYVGATGHPEGSSWGFWSAFGISLSATAVWTIVAFLIAANYVRNVDEYPRVEDFNWNRAIRRSDRIEVNVHGWDGLFVSKSAKHPDDSLQEGWADTPRAQAWISFFKRGGTLRLFVPMLPEATQNAELKKKLEANLEVIRARTGKSEAEQRREIEDTTKRAEDLNEAAGGKGTIKTFPVEDLRWICSVRFDEDHLLLSTYTTQRRRTISANGGNTRTVPIAGEFTGPAFGLDPKIYPTIDDWVSQLHRIDSGKDSSGG